MGKALEAIERMPKLHGMIVKRFLESAVKSANEHDARWQLTYISAYVQALHIEGIVNFDDWMAFFELKPEDLRGVA